MVINLHEKFSIIKEYLKSNFLISSFPLFISSTLYFCFILGSGPELQKYLVLLLNTTELSIYDSAFPNQAISSFPKLDDWLKFSFNWRFLLISIIISLLVLKRQKAQRCFLLVVVATFLVLTANDAVTILFDRQLDFYDFLISGAANLIGSFFVAFIYIATRYISEWIIVSSIFKINLISFLAYFPIAITAIVSNIFVYYCLEMFYKPLPVRLDIQVANPISGMIQYKSKTEVGSQSTTNQTRFGLIPLKQIPARINLISPRNKQIAHWRVTKEGLSYNYSISFFLNCSGILDDHDMLPKSKPFFVGKNIKSLKFNMNDGHNQLQYKEEGTLGSEFSINTSDPTQFWINSKQSENEQPLISITTFVTEKALLNIKASQQEEFFLKSIPLKIDNEKIVNSTRKFSFEVDGIKKDVSFTSSGIKETETQNCQAFNPSSLDNNGVITSSNSNAFFDIHITLSPNYNGQSKFINATSETNITNANGWLEVQSILSSNLDTESFDAVKFLVLRGAFDKVLIDGASDPTNKYSNYVIYGDLKGSYGKNGEMRFVGKSDVMWRGNIRVNPTKWERFGWDIKSGFFAVLIFLLFGILKYSFTVLQKDDFL